jgi:hypothetical protein
MTCIHKSVHNVTSLLVAAAVLALGGCSASTSTAPSASAPLGDASADTSAAQSALHFLSPNPNAPSLVSDTVRFYAVAGQDRSASLYYHAARGQRDSVEFLLFDVPAGALVQQPDGTPIPRGDSLLITIAVVDPAHLIVGFQPSGLVFNPGRPARLTLSFANADSGLTARGESMLHLWRQEQPGQQFHRIPSHVDEDDLTVVGRVRGFSVYATAY